MNRRLLSMLLVVAVIFSIVPAMGITAKAADTPAVPTIFVDYTTDDIFGFPTVTLTTDGTPGCVMYFLSDTEISPIYARFIEDFGYWQEVDEADNSVSIIAGARYLYYVFYRQSDWIPSEVQSEILTIPDPAFEERPAVSDAVTEKLSDGSVDVTMRLTPPEEVDGILWASYYMIEYRVGQIRSRVYADESKDYTVTINVQESGLFEYCAAALAVSPSTYNTRIIESEWKTCDIEADPRPDSTSAGTGARTATDDAGNVYLGGNYIEVGLSKHGSFGTVNDDLNIVPENFHTYWFQRNTANAISDNGDSLGLIADGDGWNRGNYPVAGDFFVPGTPYEAWSICYYIDLDRDGVCETERIIPVADLSGRYYPSNWSVEPVTVPVDAGDNILAARTVGTTLDGVQITLDYYFGVDDLYYTTDVTVVNNSGKRIDNAFYSRDFDPDQDQWFSGYYHTFNKTMCNPDPTRYGGADNNAMVIARGCMTGAGFFFLSMDNRATAVDDVWGIYNEYYDLYESIIADNATEHTSYDPAGDSQNVSELFDLGFRFDDTSIGILCSFGTIGAGKTDQFSYISSLDPNVQRTLEAATAGYESDLYTVNFNADGGAMTETSAKWKTDLLYSLPVATKDGYLLAGWKTDDETFYPLDEKVQNLATAGGSVTLTAVWTDTVTVKLYKDSGKTEILSSNTIPPGETFTLPTPSRDNYIFVGWEYDGVLYDGGATLEFADGVSVAELVAIWKIVCTVTVRDGDAASTHDVISGDTFTPETPDTKENYSFLGWEYKGVIYPANTEFSFGSYKTATLNAVWRENTYTITFDANGGSSPQLLKSIGATAVMYGTLPTPTHPYAEFDGWYLGDTETEITSATDNPGENVTLKAHWDYRTFDVAVNGTMTEDAAAYGTQYTYTVPDPGNTYDVTITIGGRPFYAVPDSEGRYIITGEKITGDIVITSELSDENYVILTYMFDGEVFYTARTLRTAEYPAVSLPAKSGYNVDGWFVEDSAEAERAAGMIGDGATTLYAKGTIKSIPVSFDDGDPTNVNYGAAITFPPDPADYAVKMFVGWEGSNSVIIPKSDSYGYKMPDVESLAFTSIWQNIGNLTITVQDANGAVPGATVNLIRGGIVIAFAVTDDNGNASFSGLDYGAYNIAVVSSISEDVTVTTTVGKYITAANSTLTVTVPTFRLNTVVDSSSVDMNITSENLDNAASTDVEPNQEITITLKAEPSDDAAKSAIDAQVSTDSAAGSASVQMVDYVDLTVIKKTLTDDGSGSPTETTETITTTADYQIISIEISGSLYEKLAEVNGSLDNILVYRLHGGTEVTKLAKMSEADGKAADRECYWIKIVEGKAYIVIKVRNFSTYAIGFQDTAVAEEDVTPPPVTPPSGDDYYPTYIISGEPTENGRITVSNRFAIAGMTIRVTTAPDTGFVLGDLTFRDTMGNIITLTRINDTTYTFTMPAANVTVSATFAKADCPQDETCVYARFTDADPGEWYHPGVHFCVENGYMVGLTTDKFAPNGTVSRAMIVTMLWRMEGSPAAGYVMSFKDVADGQWYTEAVRWAQSTGVVTGHSSDSFGPDDNATREQLVAILMRYAAFKGIDVSRRADLARFSDVKSISDWALESINWANAVGIIDGRTATAIAPTGDATRAEAACMVQRLSEIILTESAVLKRLQPS